MHRTPLLTLLLLCACEGPMGPRGYPGPPGPSGLDSGAPQIDAALDAQVEVPDAASGQDAASSAFTGRVRDPSGLSITRGKVVLVPASRVAALAASPIDLSLPGDQAAAAANDEPLEDLVASDPALLSAPLGNDGFRFAQLPNEPSFVVYVPAADDRSHLPGGQLARTPFDPQALRGASLELSVSGAPSEAARYIGSTACLTCHSRHSLFESPHALTLRVPGVSSYQQDTSDAPRIDEALDAFAAGTQLYYSGCTAATPDACAVSTSAPTSGEVMRVRLGRDASAAESALGRYYIELTTPTAAAQRYPVALTLGGSSTLQQYVAAVSLPSGARTHFVLPFSYQLAGDDSKAAAEDRRWVAYRVSDWVDLASGALRTPALPNAFERQCAGCHATGYAARGDDTKGYTGSAVSDPEGGVYDLDGDGRKELLAVGCEACHGPGSEHLEATPRGQHIISPRLLTPERQNVVCGACHGRHRGKQGEQLPLDVAQQMPRAGLARSTFLAQHVSSIDATAQTLFATGDARVKYQQYVEFLRSPKYRNGQVLVACSDCHDPHRTAGLADDLRSEGDAVCAGCHAAQLDVKAHIAASIPFAHDVGVKPELLTCTRCHMVQTGRSGARTPGLADVTDPNPANHEQYFHGDRASHRFVFTDRSNAAEQPVAATNSCAPCHGEFLPVQ